MTAAWCAAGLDRTQTVLRQTQGSFSRREISMLKRFVQGSITVLAMVTATFVGAAPAQAATGGGCSGGAVGACISWTGTLVAADFYQNTAGDTTRCYAEMEVMFSNGSRRWSQWFDIRQRNGRYGPLSIGVSGRGAAVNRVHVYTCSGAKHYYVDSPRLYYP
jgi:hypothetical protein